MTITAYSLKTDSSISNLSLSYVSDVSQNIFDLVIKSKLSMMSLKCSNDRTAISKINRVIRSLKKSSFDEWDNLYRVGILYKFGMKPKVLNDLKKISDNAMYLSKNINQVLLKCNPINIDTIKKLINDWNSEFYCSENYIIEMVLFLLFKERKVKKDNFRDFFNDFYSKKCCIEKIDEVKWQSIIDYLLNKQYIFFRDEFYFFPSNVFYENNFFEKITLNNILNMDFKDKDIILRRISGETLQNISDSYSQSRERIRQKQVKVLNMMPNTYEEEMYREVFEKYSMGLDDFVSLFGEDEKVYNFLHLVCHSGSKKISDKAIKQDSVFEKFNISEEKASRYQTDDEKVNDFDSVILNNKDLVFTPEKFINIYNSYNFDQMIKNERIVEARIKRCKFTISDKNRKFRYYDFIQKNRLLTRVSDIVMSLPDGMYSADKIFSADPFLMIELDIRNEYELHNYIRKNIEIFGNEKYFSNVSLSRAPGLMINISDKDEFIKHEMKSFAGNLENDFVDYMYDKYGFRTNSFRALLDTDFKDYMFNGVILSQEYEVDYDLVNNLKDTLEYEIYLEKDFEEEFYKFFDEIKPEILNAVGYLKIGDVYVRESKGSVSKTIYSLINNSNNDNSSYKHYMDSSTVKNAVGFQQTNMDLFQLRNGLYCTIDYLSEIEISKKDVIDFAKEVGRVFNGYAFFSTQMVIDKLSDNYLIDLGFSNIFYDDILNFSCDFTVIKNNMNGSDRIFSSSDYSPDDFIKMEMEEYGNGAHIYDFIDFIENKYRTKINESFVESHAGYYSNNLKKLFLSKKDYLKFLEDK
ncbi:hypothetical protein AKUH3B111A_01150 [Apilactobacillus kunkeei]|nr:hypothetical protein AKUH3B104X_01150 [Apilactobacillus kunkeei]CAI2555300.1 hypothetical protein AKUH3B111A_01150 [Apilactobacillus kunkeei]CAI2555362.1 hypothetical protein AKUH3B103M_01150 [Apilactobacillus kunkeei]CAI2612090.1 hypothetical protein AKUA2103_01120 [Apilactobacillus kunkeei]CAI2612856.1 hypothetical protein AKUA1003_01120 [Apilactobacillus kunkeei]